MVGKNSDESHGRIHKKLPKNEEQVQESKEKTGFMGKSFDIIPDYNPGSFVQGAPQPKQQAGWIGREKIGGPLTLTKVKNGWFC